MAPYLSGIAFGLFIAGVIVLNAWHRRNPMTPDEILSLNEDAKAW